MASVNIFQSINGENYQKVNLLLLFHPLVSHHLSWIYDKSPLFLVLQHNNTCHGFVLNLSFSLEFVHCVLLDSNQLCARGDTICPAPLLPPLRAAEQTQRSSTFPTPNTFPRWPLQPPYALRPRWVKRPGYLNLWPFDLESGVTCDIGYLCANFSIPRPLYSRL